LPATLLGLGSLLVFPPAALLFFGVAALDAGLAIKASYDANKPPPQPQQPQPNPHGINDYDSRGRLIVHMPPGQGKHYQRNQRKKRNRRNGPNQGQTPPPAVDP